MSCQVRGSKRFKYLMFCSFASATRHVTACLAPRCSMIESNHVKQGSIASATFTTATSAKSRTHPHGRLGCDRRMVRLVSVRRSNSAREAPDTSGQCLLPASHWHKLTSGYTSTASERIEYRRNKLRREGDSDEARYIETDE